MNPNSPSWFYEYAKVVAEHFSDRVKNFFTINEPQCVVGLGYQTGEHAPGLKVGPSDYFRIWHNVLKFAFLAASMSSGLSVSGT